MTTRTGGNSRPGGRSARVVAAAHRAVLELVAEVGYEGFELADVARRAGLNKTTVYRRWPSKADLVGRAVLSISDHDLPDLDTGSLRDDLTALVDDLGGLLGRPAVVSLLAFSAGVDPQSDLGHARSQFWNERFRRTGVIVERAVERGEVPATTDIRALLEQVCAPVYFRVLVTGEPITAADISTYVERAIAQARSLAHD
ncbi:TetR/AcrR family transcriptional regulator [Millisia brevis]|uniref:TetR/AcrR family transcriptional regulator n=1 Tax=Millisia brevis TaxID=264148 RepID=UPI0008304A63|nr:TetR/AcrR family transcriptional regulator [Millisia brevis]